MDEKYLDFLQKLDKNILPTRLNRYAILSMTAKAIYKMGKKTGRRFIHRNTVSRTKILKELHLASKSVLGENYSRYATYKIFDVSAESSTWMETLKLLKEHVEARRLEWLANKVRMKPCG